MSTHLTASGAVPLSVTQLTQQLSGVLRASFSDVWVNGEVSNYSRSSAGHAYLTLKDPSAQIRAVIWRGVHATIPFDVADGLDVLVQGSIEVYAARGQYQLTIRQLIPKGIGPLELAFRQLRDKLDREGLFGSDRKRAIPRFPRHVALVTSPNGAAIRDFLEVAGRRYRGIETTVLACAVQGDGAVGQIVDALARAERLADVDVIALVRGGGSLEDLAAFNSEQVARAIFRSRVPIVTGVGHEIDLTIADLVADVRALTPSEAAERIFPDAIQIEQEIRHATERLIQSMIQWMESRRLAWSSLAESRAFLFPQERWHEQTRRLDDAEDSLVDAVRRSLGNHHEVLASLAGPLDSLSPLKSLARGYALITPLDSPALIRSVDELAAGQRIQIRLVDGQVLAKIENVMRSPSVRAESETPS
jgi:exodeoxyribonuclease VII large subunit